MASGHWYQVFNLYVNLLIIFQLQSSGGQVSNQELKSWARRRSDTYLFAPHVFQISALAWREEACGIRFLPGLSPQYLFNPELQRSLQKKQVYLLLYQFACQDCKRIVRILTIYIQNAIYQSNTNYGIESVKDNKMIYSGFWGRISTGVRTGVRMQV